jgi:DNA-binding response OmpR family regulator
MRILVIDDEKTVADTLVLILKRHGYDARCAYDSESAYAILNASLDPDAPTPLFVPDCAICDVILPGVNGIDICSAISARFPACHIFLSSGQTETNVLVEDARERGLNWELLAKPLAPEDLLEKLAAVAACVEQ